MLLPGAAQALILQYLDRKAPVLFFMLDSEGFILQVNNFTEKKFGTITAGTYFKDLIIDFHNSFNLFTALENHNASHMLNIKTRENVPATYHFHFYKTDNNIFVFGHTDVLESDFLNKELLDANQELNNLTRQLSKKNSELIKANKKITELTRIDPLTKLANRRYFNERIEEMISMSNRKRQPLSVIMTDIDWFKYINDTFGHVAGDTVLKGFADLMKKSSRPEDLTARYGGEEFIILLPFSDKVQAWTLSERIRIELSEQDFLKNRYRVTASFGIAQYAENESMEDLIKRADKALYFAKESGRNRTAAAD